MGRPIRTRLRILSLLSDIIGKSFTLHLHKTCVCGTHLSVLLFRKSSDTIDIQHRGGLYVCSVLSIFRRVHGVR